MVTPNETSTEGQTTTDIDINQQPSKLSQLWALRNILIVVLIPILALPAFLLVDISEARCAYVIIIMAVFWTTEAIPIAVTSLLPIVLFPIMGVLTAKQTSGAYMNDTSMLFFGGLMLAVAIEVWDIHKRLALMVLMKVGSEPKWLLLGVMGVTWFLSMWISNTATTAMMITIVQAILQQIKIADISTADDNDVEALELEPQEKAKSYEVTNPDTNNILNENKHGEPQQEDTENKTAKRQDVFHSRISKCMCLAVAYSANIGGIGSLTGTGPNLILKGQADIVFNEYGLTSPISFSTWMVYGLPLSFIVVVILWFWLQAFFLRCKGFTTCRRKKDGGKDIVAEVIESEYRKLGKINYPQITVVVCFTLLVILWITRDLGGVGGWGSAFPPKTVSDSTPAILIGIIMFVLPTAVPNVFCFRKSGDYSKTEVKPLLTWQNLHEKMPWSLYLLLGGGYAIALASKESGLSEMVGTSLRVFKDLNPWLMLLILCYIITFLTEITSNTAISTLMMPILARLALSLQVNPLYFMFPAAITTSFAFMLPVATPPNAIVFSFGQVKVIDMVLAGLFMNIVSVPVLLLATATWGNSFFHFTDVDPAFLAFNETTTLATI